MEEGIKNRSILILVILCLILIISNVSSCSNAFRSKAARDKEMYSRLDMEERMSKFTNIEAALEKTIEEQNALIESLKKDLAACQSAP